MFTKKAKFKPSSNLKNSDRKKLLALIHERFATQGIEAQALLPSEVKSSRAILHNGQSVTVYTDAKEDPLWIRLDQGAFEGCIVPTLFTLWRCPTLLPRLVTVEGALAALQNGADLMFAGVFPPFPEPIKRGEVACAVLHSSPSVPLAVGILLDNELGRHKEGKALQLVHVLDDTLFSLGKDKSIPKELSLDTTPTIADSVQDLSIQPGNAGDSQKRSPTSEPAAEQPAEKADTEEDDDKVTMTPEDYDNFYRKALLQVLKKSIAAPLELPMTSSQFIVAVQANLQLQDISLKSTSWKKASKFIKAMEKEGLLKARERGGDVVITEISGAEHPKVASFEIYKVKKPASKKAPAAEQDSRDSHSIVLTEYFQPKKNASAFLEAKQYTGQELTNTITAYIKANPGLINKSNPKLINPDAALSPVTGTETIPRSEIVVKVKASCTPYYRIQSGDNDRSPFVKGKPPKIDVICERRMGKKKVTRIVGLDKFEIDLSKFAEELRVKCAGSTTVGPVREGSPEMEVLLQGSQSQSVVELLAKYGVKQQWIAVADKLKGKK